MINKKKVFVIGIFLLFISFVLAAAGVPTNLITNNNVTSLYDEGNFFVNWTSGGVDAAANYTVHLWMNDSYVNATTNANDSVTGYTFSNTTEANYTFTIGAVNATNFATNSTTNVSMYIDRTPPLVNWTDSGYTNATYKKNTEKLTLNISVGDALSGLTNSYCVFDINGTNETVAVVSEWCNTTQLNLTGLTDGNYSIDIWVNDTVGNVGVNLSSYVVWVDTTAPSPSGLTLSSSSTTSLIITFSGADGTCTASGSGTKVISGSTLTVTGLSCSNSYAYVITCTDSANNVGSSSSTSLSTSNCGGSNSVPSFWTKTFVVSEDQFIEGATRELPIKSRMKLTINKEEHYMGIVELTDTKATINVSSVSQQNIISIGEEWKVDVTGDNFYDILITLNSINSNKADVTVVSISEKIIADETGETGGEVDSGEGEDVTSTIKEKNLTWLWIIIILVIVVGILYLFKSKIPKKIRKF